MVEAWTSMAANGQPANSSQWPAWTPSKSEGITINDVVDVGPLDYKKCEFWDQILEAVLALDANGTTTNVSTSASSTATSPTSSPTSGSNSFWAPGGTIASLSLLLVTILVN
ncbi:Alpha/Beta hydrolase protein [Penicillium cosmopolitanum]|uniref:Alpha/Beta hydrolase protein n=1 Tax=Penicillium cosmopolitanum TaxID=1131564 RepID=A0A9X0BBR7_9EURO|nr:Alpha/Beta hydrolase protein [Penicillium cosmopolitanum]KAJ5403990.1 Alpha/Beta hydrolase protein [Penicillium cosmopolitanum]